METPQFNIRTVSVEGASDNYEVTIPLTWKPMYLKLFRPKLKSKVFTIKPAKIATARLVSNEASVLPNSLIGNTPAQLALESLGIHQSRLATIIALSIQNNGKKPEASLLRLIEMNLSGDMLASTIPVSIRQLQLPEFINALILIKGTASILHPSMADEDSQNIEAPTANEEQPIIDNGLYNQLDAEA
jgi:hypothetical protein